MRQTRKTFLTSSGWRTSITLRTAQPGTVLNGGTFVVPAALGNKIIHPYSDFLLHDIGTGDGIVQAGPLHARPEIP